jgi:hypothetical protein
MDDLRVYFLFDDLVVIPGLTIFNFGFHFTTPVRVAPSPCLNVEIVEVYLLSRDPFVKSGEI